MTMKSVSTQHEAMARRARPQGVHADAFKGLAGSFLTGVAVVSARQGRHDYGCTVSSFASLSLDPPLLLTCLTPHSATLEAIHHHAAFAVAILDDSDHSRLTAQKFAQPGAHPFADVEVQRTEGGLAIPASWLAWARLELWETYPGGDHEIVVGRVVDSDTADRPPSGTGAPAS
ncbi:flavin reductase family protein [Egibacter rhizosphaerae]|nr:flavin reductase family protein [Egibacter rhizosphaerae]